jgi:hypothetical protein
MKMKSKKFGVFLIIFGVVLLGLSYYIKSQVEEGKVKISSAESQVESGKKVLSLTPYTSPVGKMFSSSAEKKISKGKEDVALYEKRALWLQVIGIGCVVVGLGIIIVKKKRD